MVATVNPAIGMKSGAICLFDFNLDLVTLVCLFDRLVSVEELRTAVLSSDFYLDHDTVTHCLQWVFADVMNPGEQKLRLDLETVAYRLEMCCIHRVAPKL